MLESLQAFARGEGDAPQVTKWRDSSGLRTNLNSECPMQEFRLKGSSSESEEQAITFVLSTDDVDRHGDVISADGWVLDSCRENPVLLWAHDYRQPTIGRAAPVGVEMTPLA
jgi:hypothetical protein